MAPVHSHYPWTTTPFIANGPMFGYATHALAAAVTQARGLGFIGSALSMPALSTELEEVSKQLTRTPDSNLLPVGVGFIVFAAKLDEAVEVVRKYRPAAVWFFTAKAESDYTTWSAAMREVLPETKIWIQTGSVGKAVALARNCSPDVLVLQGSDAGGHGLEKGCSIVSLVPEAVDALGETGWTGSIVASGGIVDGRGVAAALALGASGVIMGTRFLAANETIMPSPAHRQLIVSTTDGGQSTMREKVFDELRGPNIWPVEYDGRALVSESIKDWKDGVGIEEVRKRTLEAEKEGRGEQRAAVWAGAGVGLVKRVQGAREIVEEVRGEATAVIERLKAVL